uniref:Secreted protein n=1 Tax=Ascaris lumbricoides TaxID=6252 RepID=A0A0M3IGN8_ASCLU
MCRSAIGLVTAALIGLCSKAVQSDLDSSEGYFTSLKDSPLDTVYSATNGLRSWHDDPYSFDPFAPVDLRAKRPSFHDRAAVSSGKLNSMRDVN